MTTWTRASRSSRRPPQPGRRCPTDPPQLGRRTHSGRPARSPSHHKIRVNPHITGVPSRRVKLSLLAAATLALAPCSPTMCARQRPKATPYTTPTLAAATIAAAVTAAIEAVARAAILADALTSHNGARAS